MSSTTRHVKKHAKARQRRRRTAQERLERDRHQAQRAAEALHQALEEVGLPDTLVTENELPRSKLRGINPKTPKPQNSCNWTSWRCNGLSVCAWPCFLTDWRRAASWPCRPTGLIQSPVDHKAPPHNGFLTAGTR